MYGSITKAQFYHSRVKMSEALRNELLEALASTNAALPQSPKEQSPVTEDLARDALLQSRKRRLTTSEIDSFPTKRTRLEPTDTQRDQVGDEETEQAILQQPVPKFPKQSYASFLADFGHILLDHSEPVDCPISKWLESVGLDRETHCRSDSHLYLSDSNLFLRRCTGSASDMAYLRDAAGNAVSPTPGPIKSQSHQPSTDNWSKSPSSGVSSPSSGVRNQMYRQSNLAFNNIYIRPSAALLPDTVYGHVKVIRAERDSPELSSDEWKKIVGRLDTLEDGCTEDDVATFLNDTIFPNPTIDPTYGPSTGLISSSNAPMSLHLVPANPENPYKVTQPKPDKLYGYSGNSNAAFTQPQLLAQTMLHPKISHYPAATSQGLRFPFFVIEFKAAGGTKGDLWVAANQCAGASSACLKAIDQLNILLREHQSIQSIDNLTYCIAVDNNVAKLYISWKEESLNYYLQQVDAFLLSKLKDFNSFRRQVRNILDWGRDARLKEIRDALDIILEENRKKTTESAKGRQVPSGTPAANSSKKPKSSSSWGGSNRSNSGKGQNGESKNAN
ncbi:hypothetical protein K445DRAFT_322939 [Daldinia sp. EC12]|nr:hypothetical protein K445DRAFT_322939 [Daldinia sp. EC12]